MSMNVLHATDFHNQTNTGITFAVNELVSQTLPELGPLGSVSLVSVGKTDVIALEGVKYFTADLSKGPGSIWRYAPRYAAICEEISRRQDIGIVHVHGAWMHPQLAAVCTAHRLGIPTVLTNHGLVQWAVRQPDRIGALKKRLYLALMRRRLFEKVTVHHAITPFDRDSIHSFFPDGRIEVIPNFIDLRKVDCELQKSERVNCEPYVLFIGRLHPTKGIDILIEAFGRADLPRDWRLVIVGPTGDRSYTARLRQMIAANPRSNRIELREPVWDIAAKYALMRNAWVTAVPSHTEVISLVNLESSACATPTITTWATGLSDWVEGGGLLVEPAVQSLATALSACSRWSDKERFQRGAASRRLIEERYSAATIVPRWMDLYRSLT